MDQVIQVTFIKTLLNLNVDTFLNQTYNVATKGQVTQVTY